jgi:hypothetical protein
VRFSSRANAIFSPVTEVSAFTDGNLVKSIYGDGVRHNRVLFRR